MNKTRALEILQQNVQNENLRRHCYAVGFALVGIREHFESNNLLENNSPSSEDWEILGILHDSDYETTKDDWSKHTLLTLDWLKNEGIASDNPIYKAIGTHNSKVTGLPSPQTQMEWSLECCDELTGFIVACTLIMPNKKISELEISSIKKKWKQPAFAKNVHREQIEQCEEKLNIELEQFIEIVLMSMRKNSDPLGL